ncbi:hypothetical protein GJ744_009941 [Endocarpon pusillum]|uniref:DNA2/NAM7 helicase helicase domain-containing protein n=1 Tax=Endocarpon pusillum TaxID=364733 RepID=A0A8H7AJ31_9EURO|nr:hypothetical protein GJ744_009941 [Endocarpon pusillum]
MSKHMRPLTGILDVAPPRRPRFGMTAIQKATILCCSFTNTAVPHVYENFMPEFMVVDEAAQPTEPEIWTVFAHYAPTGRLLIGDTKQLGPHVHSQFALKKDEENTNGFASQQGISFMTRLESSGFLVTTLTEQNRAILAIATTYSETFYHGSLINGAGTDIEERQLAKKLLEFNKKNYQKNHQ